MYKDKEMIYIKAITPIHAGAGQGLESVDMPIQRERHSNIPKIEASSLKGSIKHWIYKKLEAQNVSNTDLYEIFGEDYGADKSSRISFTDAKLLFFPIKSNKDIFKLITCPYVINRWIEDLNFENKDNIEIEKLKFNNLDSDEGKCITYNENENEKIFLEEYIFEAIKDKYEVFKFLETVFRKSEKAKGKSKSSDLKELGKLFDYEYMIDINKIVIINDSEFIDLVTMYTEIITRNKINVETGTVAESGLFTEEYLPSESILYFMTLGAPSFDKENRNDSKEALDYLNKNLDEVFQVGGNSTIGKGFVKRLSKAGGNNVRY